MTTTTPRPDDITITHYTVDSKSVSMPFRFRVGAVLSRIMDAVGTILSYGRLLLHHVGRGLLFLVQVPFRLMNAVRQLMACVVQATLGLLLLSIILLVVLALAHSVFGDMLPHSFPRHVPRFLS